MLALSKAFISILFFYSLSLKLRPENRKKLIRLIKINNVRINFTVVVLDSGLSTYRQYRTSQSQKDQFVFFVKYTKAGGSQLSSSNCKSANLRTNKISWIRGPSANVAICGSICELNLFCKLRICDLRTQFSC
jgi:hypothetical protein